MPTDFRQQVTTLDEFWKHKHPAELIAAKKLEKISLLLLSSFFSSGKHRFDPILETLTSDHTTLLAPYIFLYSQDVTCRQQKSNVRILQLESN